jgi:hypothetical protein
MMREEGPCKVREKLIERRAPTPNYKTKSFTLEELAELLNTAFLGDPRRGHTL